MKSSLPIITLLAVFLCGALSTCYPLDPKPPVGVPADARHFDGRWYKLVFERVPWHSAKAKCTTMGGQLVTVSDAATWVWVRGLIGNNSVWIGLTDESGSWKWVDGSAVEFAAWLQGQPDNTGGKEHYAATLKDRWNDVPKDGKFGEHQVTGFICEWRARTSTLGAHAKPVPIVTGEKAALSVAK